MNKFSVEGAWGLVLGILGIGIGLVGQFSTSLGISAGWQPLFGWAGIVLIAAGLVLGILWIFRREPSDVRAAKRAELSVQIDSLDVERLKLNAELITRNYWLTVATDYGDALRTAKLHAEIADLSHRLETIDRQVGELTAARDNIKVKQSQRRPQSA